jgi:hypothetical protein
MSASLHPKCQAVLATLGAVVVAPAAVTKAIPSAPTPGEVVGAPALVAKKAKVSKESALATLTLDESAVHRIGGENDGPRLPTSAGEVKTNNQIAMGASKVGSG